MPRGGETAFDQRLLFAQRLESALADLITRDITPATSRWIELGFGAGVFTAGAIALTRVARGQRRWCDT